MNSDEYNLIPFMDGLAIILLIFAIFVLVL